VNKAINSFRAKSGLGLPNNTPQLAANNGKPNFLAANLADKLLPMPGGPHNNIPVGNLKLYFCASGCNKQVIVPNHVESKSKPPAEGTSAWAMYSKPRPRNLLTLYSRTN
jgi:hypothetical protein